MEYMKVDKVAGVHHLLPGCSQSKLSYTASDAMASCSIARVTHPLTECRLPRTGEASQGTRE